MVKVIYYGIQCVGILSLMHCFIIGVVLVLCLNCRKCCKSDCYEC